MNESYENENNNDFEKDLANSKHRWAQLIIAAHNCHISNIKNKFVLPSQNILTLKPISGKTEILQL